jgi:uncharacterized protein YbjT (DUF2867 family)
MFRHRLAPEAEYYRLPEPPAPTIRPQSFALRSIAAVAGCSAGHWAGVQQVYELALAGAQAATRPSLLERDPFAFWN